jgi:hypothetical protein
MKYNYKRGRRIKHLVPPFSIISSNIFHYEVVIPCGRYIIEVQFRNANHVQERHHLSNVPKIMMRFKNNVVQQSKATFFIMGPP